MLIRLWRPNLARLEGKEKSLNEKKRKRSYNTLWKLIRITVHEDRTKKVEGEEKHMILEKINLKEWKIVVLFLIFFWGWASLGLASPIDGYEGALWEMSSEEVKSIFTDRDFSPLEHYRAGVIIVPVDKLIRSFHYQHRLFNQVALVTFYFFTNRLFQVRLDFWGAGGYQYRFLDELLKYLTAKYGDPVKSYVKTGTLGGAQWQDISGNTVQLSVSDDLLRAPVIVSYSQGLAAHIIELVRFYEQQEKLEAAKGKL